MRKIKNLILYPFLIVLVLSSAAFAETAKDAIKALKRLEAKCQIGISYRDYTPALGDAKLDVNMYLESEEANNNKQLAEDISEAMAFYVYAKEIWEERFKKTSSEDGLIYYGNYINYDENINATKTIFGWDDQKTRESIESSDEFTKYSAIAVKKYFRIFTEDKKSYKEGGVIVGTKFSIDIALSHIWAYSSLKIKDATMLLSNQNKKFNSNKDNSNTSGSKKRKRTVRGVE
jgi:hypothetical protein